MQKLWIGFVVACVFFFVGCGSKPSGSSGETLNTAVQSSESQTRSFATSIQGLGETDKTKARAAVMGFISSGEQFVGWMQGLYDSSIAFEQNLVSPFQSADPILIKDVGDLIKDTRTKATGCDAITDEIARQECFDKLRKDKLNETARYGVSAVVGGGASVVVGGALGAASAPILVTVAGATLAGVAVGWFVSWCTAPASGNAMLLATSSGQCYMMGGKGKGGESMAIPFKGSGKLTVSLPGRAPVLLDVQFIEGKEIVLEGNPLKVTYRDAPAATCANMSGLIISPSPADPAPHQGVTVTVSSIPVASGCSVGYSVSGTDGYTQNGTLSTNASGKISFYVPGGADGVVDTIHATGNNGVASTAVYVF